MRRMNCPVACSSTVATPIYFALFSVPAFTGSWGTTLSGLENEELCRVGELQEESIDLRRKDLGGHPGSGPTQAIT